MCIVDRPWSETLEITEGKGRGKKVIAQLGWGQDDDPRPASVAPIVERNGEDHIIDKIAGPFGSIDEANAVAVAAATAWYDRGNS